MLPDQGQILLLWILQLMQFGEWVTFKKEIICNHKFKIQYRPWEGPGTWTYTSGTPESLSRAHVVMDSSAASGDRLAYLLRLLLFKA